MGMVRSPKIDRWSSRSHIRERTLQDRRSHYPIVFNLGFEGIGFPTYKISDLLRSAFDIAFKPTASINVHGALPKNRSLEQ
jgi:hypothetical protein